MSDTAVSSNPASRLFACEPRKMLGIWSILPNALELVQICPREFYNSKPSNPWRLYAANLMNYGGDYTHWRWKSEDPEVQEHQHNCFRCIHSGRSDVYQWEDRIAVGGWMLSEMLVEVPTHVIPKDYEPPHI